MPTELQIIRAQEFIRLGASGQVDFEQSKAVLAQLAGACWKRGINQAMLDMREVHLGPKPVFSPKDLAALVNTFHEAGFTLQQRVAVLYRADPHRRARMFAFIAILHGWTVKAFDNYEAALTWLSKVEREKPEVETESTRRAKKVPVRQIKHRKAPPKPSAQPAIQIKPVTAPKADARRVRPHEVRKALIRAARRALAIVFLLALGRQAASAQWAPVSVTAQANATSSAFGSTVPNPTPAPGAAGGAMPSK